jgi:hypothetical protein
LTPLVTSANHWLGNVTAARTDGETGLVDDPAPPYKVYPANFNHVQGGHNPFAGLGLVGCQLDRGCLCRGREDADRHQEAGSQRYPSSFLRSLAR